MKPTKKVLRLLVELILTFSLTSCFVFLFFFPKYYKGKHHRNTSILVKHALPWRWYHSKSTSCVLLVKWIRAYWHLTHLNPLLRHNDWPRKTIKTSRISDHRVAPSGYDTQNRLREETCRISRFASGDVWQPHWKPGLVGSLGSNDEVTVG